eukprot:8676907-Lingulodinium_polyedra.AAC.1
MRPSPKFGFACPRQKRAFDSTQSNARCRSRKPVSRFDPLRVMRKCQSSDIVHNVQSECVIAPSK